MNTNASSQSLELAYLKKSLEFYQTQGLDEEKETDSFLDFLKGGPTQFFREQLEGHFTGSAWVVSQNHQKVLLTHHRKLGLWLHLGGHADGEIDLRKVALREAEEESGLTNLCLISDIFDLDHHRIPERAHEPEHWHYDIRYVVQATGDETFQVSDESLALAWFDIKSLINNPDPYIALGVRRMARKWLQKNL